MIALTFICPECHKPMKLDLVDTLTGRAWYRCTVCLLLFGGDYLRGFWTGFNRGHTWWQELAPLPEVQQLERVLR